MVQPHLQRWDLITLFWVPIVTFAMFVFSSAVFKCQYQFKETHGKKRRREDLTEIFAVMGKEDYRVPAQR